MCIEIHVDLLLVTERDTIGMNQTPTLGSYTIEFYVIHSKYRRPHTDNKDIMDRAKVYLILYFSWLSCLLRRAILVLYNGNLNQVLPKKSCGDVIMGAIASQINSLTIVYSTVYSDADQRKHESSAWLAFVWGINRGSVNSPHKWPVTRKMFPFDDVIMKQKHPGRTYPRIDVHNISIRRESVGSIWNRRQFDGLC